MDLPIIHNVDEEILAYRIKLQNVLELYLKKYPDLDQYNQFNVKRFNIQKYNKNGGFKKWHCELRSILHE